MCFFLRKVLSRYTPKSNSQGYEYVQCAVCVCVCVCEILHARRGRRKWTMGPSPARLAGGSRAPALGMAHPWVVGAWTGGCPGQLASASTQMASQVAVGVKLCKTSFKGGIKLRRGRSEQSSDGDVDRLQPSRRVQPGSLLAARSLGGRAHRSLHPPVPASIPPRPFCRPCLGCL